MKVDELRKLVARNVRALAKARGRSLKSVADFAGISRSQLFVFLDGEKGGSLKLIAKLAKVLEVEPWQLLHPEVPDMKLGRRAPKEREKEK